MEGIQPSYKPGIEFPFTGFEGAINPGGICKKEYDACKNLSHIVFSRLKSIRSSDYNFFVKGSLNYGLSTALYTKDDEDPNIGTPLSDIDVIIVPLKSDMKCSDTEDSKTKGFIVRQKSGTLDVTVERHVNERTDRVSNDVEQLFGLSLKRCDGKPTIQVKIEHSNMLVDFVPALKCDFWPKYIHWATRPRESGWPGEELIKEIIAEGCHVVAFQGKQDKFSWQISFWKAETLLILNFDEIQRKVFGALKLFFHLYLSRHAGTTLTTHHIKTVFLWTCESHLKPGEEDGLYLFKAALAKLLAMVENKKIEDYFLPEKNILRDTENAQSNVPLLQDVRRALTHTEEVLEKIGKQRNSNLKRSHSFKQQYAETESVKFLFPSCHFKAEHLAASIADKCKRIIRPELKENLETRIKEERSKHSPAVTCAIENMVKVFSGLKGKVDQLGQKIERANPITVDPKKLQEEISELNMIRDNLQVKEAVITNLRDLVGCTLKQQSEPEDDTVDNMQSQSQDMTPLIRSICSHPGENPRKMNDTGAALKVFLQKHHKLGRVFQQIQNSPMLLGSLDTDRTALRALQKELHVLQASVEENCLVLMEDCRVTAEKLSSIFGGAYKQKLHQCMVNIKDDYEEMKEIISERLEEVGLALKRADQSHYIHKHCTMAIVTKELGSLNEIGRQDSTVQDDHTLSAWKECLRHNSLRIDSAVQRLRCERIMHWHAMICCQECGQFISTKDLVFRMTSDGPVHTRENSAGFKHKFVTVRKAEGLHLEGQPSTKHSWYAGYSWTNVKCAQCGEHIGWMFKAVDDQAKPDTCQFWGLRVDSLKTGPPSPDCADNSWQHVFLDELKTQLRHKNGRQNPEKTQYEPTRFSLLVAVLQLYILAVHFDVQSIRCAKMMQTLNKICCDDCGQLVASNDDIISLSLVGPWSCHVNPRGYVDETITVGKVKGLTMHGIPSPENIWFSGYSWTIAVCKNCGKHIGWMFEAVEDHKPAKFWALNTSCLQKRTLDYDLSHDFLEDAQVKETMREYYKRAMDALHYIKGNLVPKDLQNCDHSALRRQHGELQAIKNDMWYYFCQTEGYLEKTEVYVAIYGSLSKGQRQKHMDELNLALMEIEGMLDYRQEDTCVIDKTDFFAVIPQVMTAEAERQDAWRALETWITCRKNIKEEIKKLADEIDKIHEKRTMKDATQTGTSVAAAALTTVGILGTFLTFGASLALTGIGAAVASAGAFSAADSAKIQGRLQRDILEKVNEALWKDREKLAIVNETLIRYVIRLLPRSQKRAEKSDSDSSLFASGNLENAFCDSVPSLPTALFDLSILVKYIIDLQGNRPSPAAEAVREKERALVYPDVEDIGNIITDFVRQFFDDKEISFE